MGAIGGPDVTTATATSTGGNDDFGGKPVDVVFKYAGVNGNGHGAANGSVAYANGALAHDVAGARQNGLALVATPAPSSASDMAVRQDRVDQLVRAFRVRGHMIAKVDPLGLPRPHYEELDPEYYGFTEADMDRPFSTATIRGPDVLTLRMILERLRLKPAYAENMKDKTVAQQSPTSDTMRMLLGALEARHGGVHGWLGGQGWTSQDTERMRRKLLG